MHRSPATCAPRTYEEILADILDKRYSKCVCPDEYQTPPSKPVTPCQFGPNCQFDALRAATAPTCPYDATACTCAVQCTCGVDALVDHPPPSPPKSDWSPTRDFPDPRSCELEEHLLLCDPSECVCDRCECDPEPSSSRLLPGVFRSALRREGRRLMTDEEMREERMEMKRLIDEVSEPPAAQPPEPDEKERAKRKKSKETDAGSKEGHKESPKSSDSPKQSLKSAKVPKVSIVEPPAEEKKGEKRPSPPASSAPKASKKSKGHKKTAGPKPARAAVQYKRRARTTELKRPPKIRYYYAGGVESYGVKLGHANCLLKPVSVPKTMGWLWNIEDPSKGIRERKGWPPGFIGKNIKNMIKVMKAFASADLEGAGGEGGVALRHWRTQPDARATPGDDREEPPLLHIRKKGRTYDITFCPKASDEDIGPVPIPFSITQKPRDGESGTDESSLEFEFHSPKLRLPRPRTPAAKVASVAEEEVAPPPPPTPAPATAAPAKGRRRKKRSVVSEENRNNWEDQPTQIEKVVSSTVAGS